MSTDRNPVKKDFTWWKNSTKAIKFTLKSDGEIVPLVGYGAKLVARNDANVLTYTHEDLLSVDGNNGSITLAPAYNTLLGIPAGRYSYDLWAYKLSDKSVVMGVTFGTITIQEAQATI